MKRRTLISALTLLGAIPPPLLAQTIPSPPRQVASSDGTQIAYEVVGEGPELLLLHGLMGNRQSWREAGYVQALQDSHRLILMDMRGHGESEGPTSLDAYDYPHLAADVAAVVNAACRSAPVIWGYSAGGGLAMAAIALHPALFSGAIIGGSYRAAVGFPEGATDGMVANARRIGSMAALPAAEVPANLRGQNIAAIAAFLEKGSYFDAGVQARLADFSGPALLYLGSEDAGPMHVQEQATGKPVTSWFKALQYVELPGELSHGEAFQRRDLVLPEVNAFLAMTA